MDEKDWLAERFEANRSRLRAVAYRMLGSTSEADDVVQDAWFRLSRSDTNAVENLDGWLTTVVGRLCLDVLRSRQARRQDALDPRVPDPVVMREDAVDPEEEALARRFGGDGPPRGARHARPGRAARLRAP